jgi:hypothetical protein
MKTRFQARLARTLREVSRACPAGYLATLEATALRSHCLSWPFLHRAVMAGAVLALCAVEAVGASARADAPAPPETPFVCAQLALAIDGSKSTRESAFKRQIDAFQAAFAREPLYHAIQDCLPGSVAFAAMTWSGADEQDLCLDWSPVADRDEGHQLAAHFEGCRYFGGSTDIGRAVNYGLRVLERSPFASYYRIVFILTNGRTDRDADEALSAARAQANAAVVTLAGYALLRPEPKNPSPFFVPAARPLERYVAERVSTGPRAFTSYSHPKDDVESLLRALIQMLRQEAS